MFLYIDPLKQGLKHFGDTAYSLNFGVFIHRSIKTRIETKENKMNKTKFSKFLYIDPLKQGLKQFVNFSKPEGNYRFYT